MFVYNSLDAESEFTMKEQFYLEFGLKKDVRNNNSVSLDHLRYGELVEKVKKLKNEKFKKKTNDYRLLKRYDVMSIHSGIKR